MMPRAVFRGGVCAAGVAVAAGAATPAMAQHLGGGEAPEVSVVRIGAALVGCLVAAIGLVVMKKRGMVSGTIAGSLSAWVGALAKPGRVTVLEARRISAHADLCLVRCDNEEFLLLCGPAGTTVLRTAPTQRGRSGPAPDAGAPE